MREPMFRFEPTGEVRELTDTDWYFAQNAVMYSEDVWLEGEYPIFRRVPHDPEDEPGRITALKNDVQELQKQLDEANENRQHLQGVIEGLRCDTAAEVAFARMFLGHLKAPGTFRPWQDDYYGLSGRFENGDRSPELVQLMNELTEKMKGSV